jgi:hypothetical protein
MPHAVGRHTNQVVKLSPSLACLLVRDTGVRQWEANRAHVILRAWGGQIYVSF